MTLPPDDADFFGRWRRIKSAFSRRVAAAGGTTGRNRKGEYALWQRRFWEHTIRDDRDFERHVNYIHFNPVKHGLVSWVREWPYSSFHRYVRQGLLPADWAGSVRGTWCGFWRTNPVIRMSRAPWSARDCRRARSVARMQGAPPARPASGAASMHPHRRPGCRDRKAAVPASGLRLLERGPLGLWLKSHFMPVHGSGPRPGSERDPEANHEVYEGWM